MTTKCKKATVQNTIDENEILIKALFYEFKNHPEKWEHLKEEPELTVHPNQKYIDVSYEAQPGDVFIWQHEVIPYEQLHLYAVRDLLHLECQPSFSKVYRHLFTDQMYELCAEYQVAEYSECEDEDMTLELCSVETVKVTKSDAELSHSLYLLQDGYDAAQNSYKRKAKINGLLNE